MPIVLNGTTGIDTPAITGITTPVSVAQGGTGAATLTSGSVLVGAGTSAISGVAPGTSGNLLTSNGSAWTSAAAPSSTPTTAQVGTATAGLAVDAVGSYAYLFRNTLAGGIAKGTNYAGSGLLFFGSLNDVGVASGFGGVGTGGGAASGTWKAMGYSVAQAGWYNATLFLRVA